MRLPNGYGSVVKMSGKRRKPYMVRKTIGWHLDETKGRQIQDFQIIGYAETRAEGLRMLAEYNQNPYDVNVAKVTFSEVYERWSKYKYPIISDSNAKGYTASYKVCGILYDKPFREIKLCDLQLVVDTCGKNYPTLKKLKGLFNQVYEYAMKNDICNKDYSQYVDLAGYRNKNPNKRDRNIFSKDELARLWAHEANPYCQIILMLNYNACRISEFLDLKKENVHLKEQYFDVVAAKTENGVRKVPIADKLLPFYEAWFERSPCEYLLCTTEGQHLDYFNYCDTYWDPLMEEYDMKHTPHDTRHTCISSVISVRVRSLTSGARLSTVPPRLQRRWVRLVRSPFSRYFFLFSRRSSLCCSCASCVSACSFLAWSWSRVFGFVIVIDLLKHLYGAFFLDITGFFAFSVVGCPIP